jgi:hypothetical protein
LPPLPPPDPAVLAPELEQPARVSRAASRAASSAVTAAVTIQRLWNRLWLLHTPKAIGCISRIRDFGAPPMVNAGNRTLQGPVRVRRPDRPKLWVWEEAVAAPLPYPRRLPGGGCRRKTACWPSGRNGTRKSPFFRRGRMRLRWGPRSRIPLQSESDRCSEA